MKLKNILLLCLLVAILSIVGIFLATKMYILPPYTVWQMFIAVSMLYFLILVIMFVFAGILRNKRLKREKYEKYEKYNFEGISVQSDYEGPVVPNQRLATSSNSFGVVPNQRLATSSNSFEFVQPYKNWHK